MSVTKDFILKLAVGIRGYALMEITETLSKRSAYQGSDISNDCIIDDISSGGIDEWVDCCLTDVPTDPGIYTFRGSVRFDEDSADYSATCDEV